MHCLITGGAGFIGSHLVVKALELEYHVSVLDNLSSGRVENLTECKNDIRFVRGDIRDREILEKTLKGVDIVFHHAALASAPESVANPLLSAEINDLGTLNLLLAANQAGVRKVVFASSAAVYGSRTDPKLNENMTVDPLSPYSVHKLAGEYYGRLFRQLYGMEVVSLRYFNVFGPRQDPASMYSGVISKFLECLRRNETPIIFGDGRQTRDFVFIDDVVAANFLAADASGVGGEAINIGTGRQISLLELLAVLEELTGRSIEPEFQPSRLGDVPHSCADIAKAAKLLKYEPNVSIENGLAATRDWINLVLEH